MFRKILFFVVLTVMLAACNPTPSVTPAAETLPVLIMDDEHFQDETVVYEIPAGNGFILDGENYTFQVPANSRPLVANYFQLVDVAVDGEFYGMDWQSEAPSNSVTVDKLQPLSGNTSLTGFRSGQTMIVAVGNMTDGFFIPLWTATIEVK